jgi:hypothetical protein
VDAGTRCDLGNAEVLDSALGEQFEHRFQNGVVNPRAAAADSLRSLLH